MKFTVKSQPEVKNDIQDGIDWYNSKEVGLGRKFHSSVKAHIELLERDPFFQVRYRNVRCLPMKKFPFMIHFTLDEHKKLVIIHAILNTNLNPEIWDKRS